MKIKAIKFQGVIFDDFALKQDEEFSNWSQICEPCTQEHKIERKYLCEDSGSGICGVHGCHNEAQHYIDFPDDEHEIIKIDDYEEKYKCMVCGKFITDDEGITTINGLWVCDNDSCRTLDDYNDAIEKNR